MFVSAHASLKREDNSIPPQAAHSVPTAAVSRQKTNIARLLGSTMSADDDTDCTLSDEACEYSFISELPTFQQAQGNKPKWKHSTGRNTVQGHLVHLKVELQPFDTR